MPMVVIDKDLTTPPGSPDDGDRYLLFSTPDAGTAWEGHKGEIAYWYERGERWKFLLPMKGYDVWADDEDGLYMQEAEAAPWTWTLVAGAGTVPAHASTHEVGGSDPITGLEQIEFEATCTATEQVRDAVYQYGAGAVRQADADALATMPVCGIIKSKPTSTTCIVVMSGIITGFTGLTADAPYFASNTPGQITASAPSGSGDLVQSVGRSLSSTELLVDLGKAVEV